jgi:hypothetical protein
MAEPPVFPAQDEQDASDSATVIPVKDADDADSATEGFGPYESAGTPPMSDDSDAGELAVPGFRPLAASSDSEEDVNSVASNPPTSVRGGIVDALEEVVEEGIEDADGEGESSDTAEDIEANDGEAGTDDQEEGEAEQDVLNSGAVVFKKKKCSHLKSGVKVTRVKRLLAAKIKKGIACQVS